MLYFKMEHKERKSIYIQETEMLMHYHFMLKMQEENIR